MGDIRYCERCGKPLLPGSKYCENCGTKISEDIGMNRSVSGREQSTAADRRGGRDRREQRAASDRENARVRREPRKTSNREDARVRREQGAASDRENARVRTEQGAASNRENARVRMEQGPSGREKRTQQGTFADRGIRGQSSGAYKGDDRRMRQSFDPYRDRNPSTNFRMPDPQAEDMQRRQFRQEHLERDWEQAWDRRMPEEDESKMTPIQYVLIGLTAVLLIALIVFGAFWVMGRSKNRDAGDRMQAQTEMGSETEGVISVLDGTQDQSETKKETEKTPQSETQKQSETQPATEAPKPDIVLDYQEFKVTLPGSWTGKYGITQGTDYYTFYHQASKAKGYNGALFTISRYTDTSYQNLPNYQVLGTGNNAAFVLELPTDVQYPTDDETVKQEYQKLQDDLNTVKSKIQVLVSGEGPKETEPVEILDQSGAQSQTQQPQTQQPQTQPSGSGYIAESSQRSVTESDVAGMSYNDLQMAINEIYARHGRKFSDPNIQSYFDSQPWYQGTVEPDAFDSSVFSATEGQNIQYLLDKMEALQ